MPVITAEATAELIEEYDVAWDELRAERDSLHAKIAEYDVAWEEVIAERDSLRDALRCALNL